MSSCEFMRPEREILCPFGPSVRPRFSVFTADLPTIMEKHCQTPSHVELWGHLGRMYHICAARIVADSHLYTKWCRGENVGMCARRWPCPWGTVSCTSHVVPVDKNVPEGATPLSVQLLRVRGRGEFTKKTADTTLPSKHTHV